ncbi:class IV adenylate cyclase [Candidatus Woesearchaeota archaeon CG10_big_fil_rev_8_21_14_0_10_44_13]|nr:MAG: class IV adenylate cyclase [Candidatus Woesearchaeota archaeon CG10_big_fil_rev_8_21_14_0_10_44_13]
MPNKDIEIEIKFPLKNPQETVGFLENNAKLVSRDVFQKDTYFTPHHRKFIGRKYPFEWLRLRETPKGSSINYKHFYPEDAKKTDYCDEFQTSIGDADTLRKILASLNFREVIVVEKSRSCWLYKDVEIAIDDIKGLGQFIELEAQAHYSDPKKGKEYLYSILSQLSAKVGEEDTRGYPYRILEKNGHKFG